MCRAPNQRLGIVKTNYIIQTRELRRANEEEVCREGCIDGFGSRTCVYPRGSGIPATTKSGKDFAQSCRPHEICEVLGRYEVDRISS